MPHVNIRITREGATDEQKAALIKGATQLQAPDPQFCAVQQATCQQAARRGHKGGYVVNILYILS